MKIVNFKTIFVLFGLLLTSKAFADGNELLQQCQNAVRFIDGAAQSLLVDAGECLGTVQGTVDTLEIARHTFATDKSHPIGPMICWPQQVVPKAQSVRIIVKYLEDNPKDLSLNGSTLVILALSNAYPCR